MDFQRQLCLLDWEAPSRQPPVAAQNRLGRPSSVAGPDSEELGTWPYYIVMPGVGVTGCVVLGGL